MRRSCSMLAAAAIAITGAASGFAPAQAAAPLAIPALASQADQSAGIVEVRHRGKRHREARRNKRNRVIVKNYYYVPAPYAYYPAYPRYYSRPGISFSFSIGGGHKHHRRHGW